METYSHEDRKRLREVDWSRNVRDGFVGMNDNEIKAALAPLRSNLVFAFCNALRDFNFAGIIRASNAFACESVIYSGFRKFDPRGAVGTTKYENIYHIPEIEGLKTMIDQYKKNGYDFAVAESETFTNSIMLPEHRWNRKTIVMFGEEGTGVPTEFIKLADFVLTIPQIGSVRSINVASSAHIIAYDYMIKTGRM